MYLRTEFYTSAEGEERAKDLYGYYEEEKEIVTSSVDRPAVEPEPEPTEPQPDIEAEILLNQMDIITKQNEQDEVLAEILLNQIGG